MRNRGKPVGISVEVLVECCNSTKLRDIGMVYATELVDDYWNMNRPADLMYELTDNVWTDK
jgi:hypothetical protein